jgi:hypothetical protein
VAAEIPLLNEILGTQSPRPAQFPRRPDHPEAVKRGFVAVEGGVEAPWWTAQVRAGGYMWLPGAAYLNAIYEEVRKHGGGTGSITADLWNRLKDIGHYIAYGLAFVGGLVHGFVASLWDAIAGIASMIYDVLKSIFTLNVVSDVKELIKTIEGLSGVVARIGDWWRGFGWDRTQSPVLIRIPSCRSRPTLRVATIFRSRSAR